QATPATYRMLIEAGWKGDPRLKILCGGEAMPRDLADALLTRCGSLWNMYGPTETTIWSTIHRVTSDIASVNVPIGKPIANTQVYVLDANLQPAPEGELFIGGDGVARGYLNRASLTAQRFVPDPFGAPGARMYRTGDAVRLLSDGSIEYLERLDHQVKVRGYRIELGEIENALRKQDGVANAVVIARDDLPGGKALVAYCIARGTLPSAAALREHLRATLPEYMVPSHFATLDAFPLTPNGKIDRKALPAPARTSRDDDESYVAPRNETEEKLAAIWSDVLHVPRVGVCDNFFELGGDSFLAVRLFLQIEQTFGRELPLVTLLSAPTLEGLARAIESDTKAEAWSPLVPLQLKGAKRPLFVVHGVGGNVLNYRALSHHLGNDQPFYALQARGIDGTYPPLTRVEDMARLYVDEIRRVQPRGPYLLAGLSFGGVVAFEMAQQLRAAGHKTTLVALFESAPVSYGRLARQEAYGDPTDTLTRRLKVHASELMRRPDRATYFRKKVRRVWRRVVYRAWQLTFAIYEKLRRPLPRALQDVQQANYLALRNYRPSIYPGDVVFFYAEGEPEGFTREKQHGWSILAGSGVHSEQVPGDHLTMLDEPHVKGLADKLNEWLAERGR
ncbi:MAG TPA: non-ribosomal peptide synthetase, partial [Thermoanaerobaculia bacterium]